jgi:hypothetical protein
VEQVQTGGTENDRPVFDNALCKVIWNGCKVNAPVKGSSCVAHLVIGILLQCDCTDDQSDNNLPPVIVFFVYEYLFNRKLQILSVQMI